MVNKKYALVSAAALVFSIISGFFSGDLIIGGSILLTGLLCAYFASEGKSYNYIFGFINYALMSYVSLINNLYGIFFFYAFVCAPLQIWSYAKWKKNSDRNNDVIVREFTLKNSVIITTSCIAGSLLLGFLLNLIPSENLAFMDATSNCINLCGIILMMLRFKEAWWLWLANNIADFTIWIIIVIGGGEGSIMMLLVSIGYLLINIYGIIEWQKKAKKRKKASN